MSSKVLNKKTKVSTSPKATRPQFFAQIDATMKTRHQFLFSKNWHHFFHPLRAFKSLFFTAAIGKC